ncbi:hypothetical protein [Ramlibacter sp.]|uniref:hypothetical protein n=1 Tax=Ramlibacter sp. TaxID=1917967 RepID=UPI002D59E2E5|nr:hypothetical protein [Ramlibacter sp.]HYD75854.1 hypothetical protein [Ramlibacter sp.]
MKKDKQPRRASKDLPLDQLHPASDMGKRAKGGDKVSNRELPRRMKGSEQTGVAAQATREPSKKGKGGA